MERTKEKSEVKYYTTTEVASILQLTQRSIYKFLESGELRAFKLAGWRIAEDDLKAFIDSRETNEKK